MTGDTVLNEDVRESAAAPAAGRELADEQPTRPAKTPAKLSSQSVPIYVVEVRVGPSELVLTLESCRLDAVISARARDMAFQARKQHGFDRGGLVPGTTPYPVPLNTPGRKAEPDPYATVVYRADYRIASAAI